MKIGLIGCGNMGGAMAVHLAGSAHAPLCFDPDPQSLARVAAGGCQVAASQLEVAAACDLIILSLPTADIVRGVMEAITPHVAPGSVVIDTSTSEPGTTRDMNRLAKENGFSFVDAPVSGGPAAAGTGTMTMLIGGDDDAVLTAQPVLDLLGSKIVRVGPSGSGHAAKIANNLLCAANLVLVSEMVRLGVAAGVKAEDLLEGINAGSGRSGVSEVNFPRWILDESFDSGFTMGLMRKDVKLAIDLAAEQGMRLPASEAIADIWNRSRSEIADDADFNCITKYQA